MSKSYWFGMLALTLTFFPSPGNAERLFVSQIKSLIPPGDGLTCTVLKDQITIDISRQENTAQARIFFNYSYDFHFTPDEQAWLVSNSVTGNEVLEVNMNLELASQQGTEWKFENEQETTVQLKGKVKNDNEPNFHFYQRPARVDVEITYKEKDKKALIKLYILWLDEIPGYGVYDPFRGAGIIEKLEGDVYPYMAPALSNFSNLTNHDYYKQFPSLIKEKEQSQNNLSLPTPE